MSGAAVGRDASPPVEVRRSARRTRTVSAYRRDGRVVVLIPARFTAAEERTWVATMLERLARSEARAQARGRGGDQELQQRAEELAGQYLPPGTRAASVRWVDNMTTRWGSCTSGAGTIRLSDRLRAMPDWVVDYVLLHELAHLVEPDHSRAFWALVDPYPRAERAKGYLEGVAAAEAGRG